jgi:D-3-phosphoglycerate dehydrogenase
MPVFVFDFDGTIVSLETLDLLAELSGGDVAKIKAITDSGMSGGLPIDKSISQRISLLSINKSHIEKATKILKKNINPSILKHKNQIKNLNAVIVSSGFHECIDPIAKFLGFKKVFANRFTFDSSGNVTGFDKKNPLAKPKGKVKICQSLGSEVYIIGDGATDLEVFESGAAKRFYYYAESILREDIARKAYKTVYGIDEILYESELPTKYSFPRSKLRVLLLEGIDKNAIKTLKNEGYRVETYPKALSEEELLSTIGDYSVLGVRSKTKLSAKVLHAGRRLHAIGVFSVGTSGVDLKVANQLGIAVFNAPFSNTRSVVELAVGEIIFLMRRAFDQARLAHGGEWQKVPGYEVRGKTLGIIGYGNIGSQLSILAEAMGMNVLYYDISVRLSLGNAKPCKSLKELLRQSDVVSVHVEGNRTVIGEKEISLMKQGALLLNLSRGQVVDEQALAKAIKSGKLGGAGVDVFPNEPKANGEPFSSPLCGLPNVILTPHIGGSTVEAQRAIGEYVSERLLGFLNFGDSTGSVSIPQARVAGKGVRLLHIHKNVPGIIAQVNGILAKNGVNILGQELKTNPEVGYMITDISKKVSDKVLAEIRSIPDTIKLRVVYP